MRPERISKLPPKERILDAAEELFYEEGIGRVTVDAIAAKAKSTKMTLYRHFTSKEELVIAWLELLINDYSVAFESLSKSYSGSPKAQIIAFAQFISDNLSATSSRGCPFTNSLAELPDSHSRARELIEQHKKNQFRRLEVLCLEAGLTEPNEVAKELTYLMEGALVVSQNKSIENVGDNLMKMVRRIVYK